MAYMLEPVIVLLAISAFSLFLVLVILGHIKISVKVTALVALTVIALVVFAFTPARLHSSLSSNSQEANIRFAELVKTLPADGYSYSQLMEGARPYQRTQYIQASATDLPPIEIVVFSDPLCMFCQMLYAETLPRIAQVYSGTIWVTHRHVVPIRSMAGGLAVLSECVGMAQGDKAYFSAVKKTHREPRTLEETITELSTDLGLDANSIKRCMITTEARERVLSDVRIAQKIKVHSLPTWFIGIKSFKRFEGYVAAKDINLPSLNLR